MTALGTFITGNFGKKFRKKSENIGNVKNVRCAAKLERIIYPFYLHVQVLGWKKTEKKDKHREAGILAHCCYYRSL